MLSLAASITALSKPPVVLVPGFGNAVVDYISPLGQSEDVGLCSVLRRRGFDDINVVPVQRWEWVRVAGGLTDPDFYTCQQRPTGRAYGWFVQRIRDEIDAARARTGQRVLVVAHSAGGWLARAALGGVPGDGAWARQSERVAGLVTLGAPHAPPPDRGTCATRGALAYTDDNYPGAFLDGVAYTTVAGTAIVGNEEAAADAEAPTESAGAADAVYAERGEGSYARVAFVNYQALSGDGTVAGDGVIPVAVAHLDGARQLTLENVLHSINEAGTTLPTDRWYGSEAVVDRWLAELELD